MKKLLVFLKGSSIHRTAFFSLSTLYPSIELSTFSIRTLERDLNLLKSAINIHSNNYQKHLHIVALGDYSLNTNYIRIELISKNIFRRTVLGEKEFYKLNSYFELMYLKNKNSIPSSFKLKISGTGNGRCNLFSYKLNKYLSELPQDLKSKIYFDFLHVPSKFHATDDIAQILGGTNTHLLY